MDIIREFLDFEQKFFALTSGALENTPYGVYDLKYISGSSTMRLFILKDVTVQVGIDDCAKVDRLLSEDIEVADWIPDSFILEVSSPGVYRDINSLGHFNLALGERVTLNLFKKALDELNLKDNKITGELKEVLDDAVIINVKNDKEIKITLDNVKKAKVDPRFEDLKQRHALKD